MTTKTGRPLSYLATISADQVKGIGPRTAKRLSEAGIDSVADLLLHTPRRYLDRSQLFDLSAVPLGEEVTVGGTVLTVRKRRISRNRTMIDAVITDGTNVVTGVWFNPYLRLAEGAEVALSGKVERFRGRLQMKSPDVDTLGGDDSLVTGRVVPIHPSIAGLGPAQLRRSIHNALTRSSPIHESFPAEIVERLSLPDRDRAFQAIHFPETMDEVAGARRRLVFDELFRLEVALAMQKRQQASALVGVAHQAEGRLSRAFIDALPYELTAAQVRSLAEIRRDMADPRPMHRLLQGEVGSGKTVVAAAALLLAVEGGYQGAVMAPTEVLAEQHFIGFRDLVDEAGLSPTPRAVPGSAGTSGLFEEREGRRGLRIALLTSARVRSNFHEGDVGRSEALAWIVSGDVDIVVGTHSLIQDDLHFAKLGAAVVDEQHRFGVYQRVRLREKSSEYVPDLLIMTATPIPRTLAMTLYGDLDVSILDELPPGRTPTTTEHVTNSRAELEGVYERVRNEAAAGRQAFVVCPLVDESDKLEAASATAEYDRLRGIFPGLRLGLLHGQLKSDEKEETMRAFRDGAIDVLVATTVIEVGIDIPNATVMIVEDADRFGLSQLHQLRGRVGRGDHDSRCILIAEPTTAEAEARIAAMVSTADGFELAEEDLRIRGQGTVFGTRQAGLKDLKLADILRDAEILVTARREAFALIDRDPVLRDHPELAEEVRSLLGEDVEWLFRS